MTVDKIGNFIGDLYLPGEKDPISFNLLRQGVCFINDKSIEFCSRQSDMEECEDQAIAGRKGYWMNYKEEVKV